MLTNPMSARTTFCLLFFLNFLARTLAAPAGTYDSDYSNQGNTAKIRVDSNSDHDSCSFKLKAPLCSSPGTCLPPPPKNSKPVAVVLGVGTQNYTCTSPTQKPTPNGAIATLYDITKSAGLTPDAAHAVSAIVMALSTVQNIGSIPPGLGYPKIGEHHFESKGGAAAAVFNVRVQEKNLKFVGGRLEGIAPPANSFPGTIDWLKLGRTVGSEGESHGIKFVYRVYTAGGKAPATCAGLRSEHTVKYAAEYWFYN